MRPSLVAELFLDASYAIALSSISDKHHEQALTLAREIEIDPTIRLVTTRAVLLEIGNPRPPEVPEHRGATPGLFRE